MEEGIGGRKAFVSIYYDYKKYYYTVERVLPGYVPRLCNATKRPATYLTAVQRSLWYYAVSTARLRTTTLQY